jgi:hypothetical protein
MSVKQMQSISVCCTTVNISSELTYRILLVAHAVYSTVCDNTRQYTALTLHTAKQLVFVHN